MENEGPRVAKTTLKKNTVGGLRLPASKIVTELQRSRVGTTMKTDKQMNGIEQQGQKQTHHIWSMDFQQSDKSFKWEKILFPT